ncbi:MAG: hypothetical protein AAGD25_11795 [Cyanobacteria bacterium P01_F01_bin.150]
MTFNWPTEELTVSGKIGIGTDDPSEALEVVGDISATNLTLSASLVISKTLTVGNNFQLGSLSVNKFSNDGSLASNSSLAIPTEQAVKTYVDAQMSQRAPVNGAINQDFEADNLSVGGTLRVSGDLEVQGNVIARDTEHIEGDVSLGDQDNDVVAIAGVIRSTHSSGALQVNSGVHTTGALSVDGALTVGGFLNVAGGISTTAGNITGSLLIDSKNNPRALHCLLSGEGNLFAIEGQASGGDGVGIKCGVKGAAEGEAGTMQGLAGNASGGTVGDRIGVYGSAAGGTIKYGVIGSAEAPDNGGKTGVSGIAGGGTTGNRTGIVGRGYGGEIQYGGQFKADSQNNMGNTVAFGVHSIAQGSKTNYGIWATATDGQTNWAGYFQGDVHITGTISKGGGSFLIDHPLAPLDKTLRHNFVESPEDLCLYRGKVKLNAEGYAMVKMPEYFAALTKEEDATVTLTPVGQKGFLVSYEWHENFTSFDVFGIPDAEVSYLVLADRDDPAIHQFRKPVEEEKGNGNFEQGKLLYPEAYGYPKTVRVDYVNLQQSIANTLLETTM